MQICFHSWLVSNLFLGSKRAGVQCETCVRFMLTPTDEEKLASSEYEIHLRFCPYDSYKEKKVNDEYPRQLYVRVNEVPVSIAVSFLSIRTSCVVNRSFQFSLSPFRI